MTRRNIVPLIVAVSLAVIPAGGCASPQAGPAAARPVVRESLSDAQRCRYDHATQIVTRGLEPLDPKEVLRLGGYDMCGMPWTLRTLPNRRTASAIELLHDGSARAESFLAKSARVGGENQACALEALYRCNPRRAAGIIDSVLAEDDSQGHFDGAAESLWRCDPDRADQELRDAVVAGRPCLVYALTNAMPRTNAMPPATYIPLFLNSNVPVIRQLGAFLLAYRGDVSALPVLGELLLDPDGLLDPRAIAEAIGRLYEQGGREICLEWLGLPRQGSDLGINREYFVYSQVIEHATAEDADTLLSWCLQDHFRWDSVRALCRVAPEKALPLLRELFADREDNIGVRLFAASVLGKQGDARAVRFVEESCYADPGAGQIPLTCLIDIGNDSARAAFNRVLETAARKDDKDRAVRSARDQLGPFGLPDSMHCLKEWVWPGLAAHPRREVRSVFWSRVTGHSGPFADLQPPLRWAMDHQQTGEVLRVLEFCAIEGGESRAAASKWIDELTLSADPAVAGAAWRIGINRGLVGLEAARSHVLKHKPTELWPEAVDLLVRAGHPEDVDFLAPLLDAGSAWVAGAFERRSFDRSVFAAIAVRRLLRGDKSAIASPP